jgi:hypothetical protein
MNKQLIYTVLFLILPLAGIGQFTHVGPLAAFSSQVKEPGFGLQGIFRVNDAIKLSPNALYYLPHEITTPLGKQKFTWWMINLDGNYVILNRGVVEGFGLMGLNFSNVTAEQDEEELGQPFKDKRSMLELGLNIGAGMRLKAGDKVVPFAEVRYTLGSKADFNFAEISTSQFGVFAGVMFRIAEDKDRTATEDY